MGPTKQENCVIFYHQNGQFSAGALIEWIELNNILGIEEFNFYESDLSDEAIKVLQHYASTGLVRLQHVAPPIFDKLNCNANCHLTSTTATVNDCLYRNINRYKYIVILDLDEIIIPHRSKILHLHELIDQVNKHRGPGKPPVIQYSFMNMLFLLEFPPTDTNGDKDIDELFES